MFNECCSIFLVKIHQNPKFSVILIGLHEHEAVQYSVCTWRHGIHVGVPKLILQELNSILMETSSFVSVKNMTADQVSEKAL